MEARLGSNVMCHFWRQSIGSVDLDQAVPPPSRRPLPRSNVENLRRRTITLTLGHRARIRGIGRRHRYCDATRHRRLVGRSDAVALAVCVYQWKNTIYPTIPKLTNIVANLTASMKPDRLGPNAMCRLGKSGPSLEGTGA
jgi:hypothetical protein